MKICKVIGKAQASLKHEGMTGLRLFVVEELNRQGKAAGNAFLAVDRIGAGEGEVVAVVTGRSAAENARGSSFFSDATIVAILDKIKIENKDIYTRDNEKEN